MWSQKAAAPSLSVLVPPLSPPDWSSSVAASCFLPPSLSEALYVARPLSSVSGGSEGEGLQQHTDFVKPSSSWCSLMSLLFAPSSLHSGNKKFFLRRRSDIITAAAHRKFWAPRRRRDFLKPALPQTKCLPLKLQRAALNEFND